MNIDPYEKLCEGSRILDPILEKHGFHFKVASTSKGSGGKFAVGEYSRGFERLRDDLERYCADFLTGDGQQFCALAAAK